MQKLGWKKKFTQQFRKVLLHKCILNLEGILSVLLISIRNFWVFNSYEKENERSRAEYLDQSQILISNKQSKNQKDDGS